MSSVSPHAKRMGANTPIILLVCAVVLIALGVLIGHQLWRSGDSETITDHDRGAVARQVAVQAGVPVTDVLVKGSSATIGSGSCKLDPIKVKKFISVRGDKSTTSFQASVFNENQRPVALTHTIYVAAIKACTAVQPAGP